MIDIIEKYLLKIVDDIDADNSNLTDSEVVGLVITLTLKQLSLQSTSGLRMMTIIAEAVKYISTLGEHNKLGGVQQ